MTIDQKSLAEDAENAQNASPEASQFIRTWPPSEEELDQLESDLKAGKYAAPTGQTISHVEEWPDWLQKRGSHLSADTPGRLNILPPLAPACSHQVES